MRQAGPSGAVLSEAGQAVRRHDPDRYLAALFTDPTRRERLFALYAFNHEIAAAAEVVSEPMLGEIRLQWWRDQLPEITAGESHPPNLPGIAGALAAACRGRRIDPACFERVLDARSADFTARPFADMAALLAYAQDTSATLSHIALGLLDVPEEEAAPLSAAVERVAIAFALTGLVRAIPYAARAGRCTLPTELMEQCGARFADYSSLRDHDGLCRAVQHIATAARDQLASVMLPDAARFNAAAPLLLPGRLARFYLDRIERAGGNPFDPAINAATPGQSWRLWWAFRRRRL